MIFYNSLGLLGYLFIPIVNLLVMFSLTYVPQIQTQ
jgi:hypothetical protein